MKEVLEQQGLSLNSVFPDPANPGKMCKNCYRSYFNLFTKCSKFMDNLGAVAQKIQLQSDPAGDATAPATPGTPCRKRGHEYSHRGATRRRRISLESGSPSVVVSLNVNVTIRMQEQF